MCSPEDCSFSPVCNEVKQHYLKPYEEAFAEAQASGETTVLHYAERDVYQSLASLRAQELASRKVEVDLIDHKLDEIRERCDGAKCQLAELAVTAWFTSKLRIHEKV